MNITIFSERLRECRKRKFSSQQEFADAYMNRFGLIRQGKKTTDNNMFGTIQSWEQGKSEPTASVLSNICDLLECDADYLLGRINERTHDISDAQKYTGLSSQALEQLHEYRENLAVEPNWQETIDLEEKWGSHKYYQAFALYLIDELLVGSEHHKLTAHVLHNLFSKIQEDEIAVHPEDYGDDEDTSDEDRTLWAAQDQELVDITTFIITNNIRDIITENAIQNKFPLALEVDTSKGTYFFSINK